MNEKNIFDDVAVLVVGYDGYEDVWVHFFNLLNRYWACRPKTYLATSELEPKYENVTVIKAGPKTEWSKKVQAALSEIKATYIILLLEDFFISDYVDNQKVLSAIELMNKYDIDFYQVLVQLVKQSWEKGRAFCGNKHIHIVPHDKRYGINLQAAIWRKEFLHNMVGDENYNAWQFEINQLDIKTYNVDKVNCLIDDRNILNIVHAVVQSKYLPGALKKLAKRNYFIDNSEREKLDFFKNFKYQFKLLMYSLTPKCLVRPFKYVGRILGIDFVTDRIRSDRK